MRGPAAGPGWWVARFESAFVDKPFSRVVCLLLAIDVVSLSLSLSLSLSYTLPYGGMVVGQCSSATLSLTPPGQQATIADGAGNTAAHYAARHNRVALLAMLQAAGADLTQFVILLKMDNLPRAGQTGFRPLHVAALYGSSASVRYVTTAIITAPPHHCSHTPNLTHDHHCNHTPQPHPPPPLQSQRVTHPHPWHAHCSSAPCISPVCVAGPHRPIRDPPPHVPVQPAVNHARFLLGCGASKHDRDENSRL